MKQLENLEDYDFNYKYIKRQCGAGREEGEPCLARSREVSRLLYIYSTRVQIMRYLLDTNIFVYLAEDRESLNKDVIEILQDYDSQLYISSESVKELVIAFNNKKLLNRIWEKPYDMIKAIEDEFFITILPIKKEHLLTYAGLQINSAQDHNDPFDHVIISHAITERLTLISSDTKFPFYCKQGLDLIVNHK